MLRPVRRQSLSDAVFEQLREQIVSGEMEPGTTLPAERLLSEKLGVNRGAVREALKRLEQARLVAIQQGGATRVADFLSTAGLDLLAELLVRSDGTLDTTVARSVIEMRSALGPDIARLAALRADDAQRCALVAVVERMEGAAGDLPALQRLAMEFWRTAVEASGNLAYRLAYNTLSVTYERCFDLLTQVLAEELSDLAAYRAIAKAVQKGDTARAERRAAELMSKGAERIFEVVEALDALHGGDR